MDTRQVTKDLKYELKIWRGQLINGGVFAVTPCFGGTNATVHIGFDEAQERKKEFKRWKTQLIPKWYEECLKAAQEWLEEVKTLPTLQPPTVAARWTMTNWEGSGEIIYDHRAELSREVKASGFTDTKPVKAPFAGLDHAVFSKTQEVIEEGNQLLKVPAHGSFGEVNIVENITVLYRTPPRISWPAMPTRPTNYTPSWQEIETTVRETFADKGEEFVTEAVRQMKEQFGS